MMLVVVPFNNSPSIADILTHIVAPAAFVYLISHRPTRRYVLYLIITVLCLSYGYSIILKPILYAAYNLLWWIFKVPVWALYGLRWISWQIIRGIRALAWFGFYVHFCGYAMKFILESVEKVLIWMRDVQTE
ncbi:hypothetical protein F5051DRAFT_8625 [Lentinula edodes]|nr:hypothetical protein F5051DRAFT_8625 [Lentinula edodes]